MLWRKIEQGVVTESEGSEYLYSWVDWGNLSALWEKTLNRAWGRWRMSLAVIGRVTAKVVAGASLSLQSEGKGGWAVKDKDAAGCHQCRGCCEPLGDLGLHSKWLEQEPEGILSAGTTLTTCIFFKLPFGLLCTEGLRQRRRKEDCAITAVTLMAAWTRGSGKVRGQDWGYSSMTRHSTWCSLPETQRMQRRAPRVESWAL